MPLFLFVHMQRCNIFSSLHGVSKLQSPKQMVQRLKTNKQTIYKEKKINDGCAIPPIGESLILLNKWYMIAFQLVFFLFSILYIASWSIFLSRASEDTVNLARLQHCTYLSPSIILALTAALYVAVCNISWLISVDRAVLKRPRRVTLALLASLWRLSSHLLFDARIAFVVVGAALNCWFLFVRPGSSHLSKEDGCAGSLGLQ